MKAKEPRLSSAVLVINEGKFLLGKRNKVNANGMWVIPGGGVNFGESTEKAALRELKEETNLDVNIIKFLGHKEIIAPENNYHSIVFFYLAEPKHMNIEPREDISDVKFFDIDEIKNLNIVRSVEWVLKDAGFWKD